MPRKRRDEQKIIYVQTSEGNSYYAYDYYESELGTRRRIYAGTKEQLEEKIQHMKEAEDRKLAVYLPETSMLKDWCGYYFRSIIGKSAPAELKNLIMLFQTSVYGTEIDCDMTEITVDDMKRFYLVMETRYDMKNVKKIDEVMRKIFQTANEKGIQTFDFSEIPVPEKIMNDKFREIPSGYIPSAQELEQILDKCMTSASLGTLAWAVAFAVMTGIPLPKIARLTNKDFDFEKQTVTAAKCFVPIDGKCVEWLKSMIVKKFVLIMNKGNEGEEIFKPITCYRSAPAIPENFTPEQIVSFMAEHTETRDEFITNYMKQNPDDFMFVSNNNKPVDTANAQRILRTIAAKCNIPKGITGKSLHKAFIAAELEKGKSPELLKTRYGYKKESDILEIKADYDVRRMLL